MRPPRKPAPGGLPRGAHKKSTPPTLLEQRSASQLPSPSNKQSGSELLTFLSTRRQRAAGQQLGIACRFARSCSGWPSIIGQSDAARLQAGVPKACRCFDLTTAARQLRRPAAVAGGSSHPFAAAAGAVAHTRGVTAELGHVWDISGQKRPDIRPAPARPRSVARAGAIAPFAEPKPPLFHAVTCR